MSATKRRKSTIIIIFQNKLIRYSLLSLLTIAICGYFFRYDIYRWYWKRYVKHENTATFKNFGVPLPDGYDVHGIDVSYYQNEINWKLVKNMSVLGSKVNFAFIKATEGATLKDLCFDENWKGSKNNGILRGAYHFFRPHIEAERQANNFINSVKISKGDLPPVLDVEVKGGTSSKKMVSRIKEWLRLIENHYGVKPIIYTNVSFYKKYLNDDELKQYPLWIAHYYEEKLTLDKNEWAIWQHTDKACIDGIEEEVDMNVFNGSLEQLESLCK